MNTKKAILLISSLLLVTGFSFWLYQKKRISDLNKQVDTLESAYDKLDNI